MKKSSFLAMLMILALSVSLPAQSRVNPGHSASKWHSIVIQTSGTCQRSKEIIESGLSKEEGVKSVNYDLASAKVKVVYNNVKTNPAKLRKAINQLGFDADNQRVGKTSCSSCAHACGHAPAAQCGEQHPQPRNASSAHPSGQPQARKAVPAKPEGKPVSVRPSQAQGKK